MTVGTAVVLLQMSETPVIFGCAETVAKRLTRCTASAPACAVQSFTEDGIPQFALTEYGQQVKERLEKWVCLNGK
jgi:hypothetical protein